jgi:hypothetical protein
MLKILLNLILQIILGSLKTFAMQTVSGLNLSEMTNEEKRNAAFADIKEKAINEGKTLRDSLISLAIEACVSYLKR